MKVILPGNYDAKRKMPCACGGVRCKVTGRILLREILELALGLPGVMKAVLSVSCSAEPAIRLCTREGFRTNYDDQGTMDKVLEVGEGVG